MKIKGILLNFMIVFAIMLGLIPVLTQTVSADTHNHDAKTFTEWTDAHALPQNGGSYYLSTDVTLTNISEVQDTVDLCLNGHNIYLKNNEIWINVSSGGCLNLYDCSESPGTITHTVDGNTYSGSAVTVGNGGIFQMNGGKISGNRAFGVEVGDGTFQMTGGSIKDNHGGVHLTDRKTIFNVEGKVTITGNKIPSSGSSIDRNVLIELVYPPNTIHIGDNGLDPAARIGVTMKTEGFAFTSNLNNHGSASNFISDDPNYTVGPHSTGELMLGHFHDDSVPGGKNDFICACTSDNSLPDNNDPGDFLTKDVTLTEPWETLDGTRILCMNGHSITLDGDTNGSSVIEQKNTWLQIYDCKGTGYITHKNSESGAGVNIVGQYGRADFFGVCISGNPGAGVIIGPDASLEMHGGKISGNGEAGVVVQGKFSMSGGEISGNTANGKPCNVYLYPGKKINIIGQLSNQTPIGVTLVDENQDAAAGVFTTGWKDNMGNADPADYFVSDDTHFVVILTEDKQEAQLVWHDHIWTYSAQGDTITATCGGVGRCPLGDQTAKLSLNNTEYIEGDTITPTVTLSKGWTAANGFVALPTSADVKYVSKSGTADYDSSIPPTKAGSYSAQLTVEGYTVSVDFTISKKPPKPEPTPTPEPTPAPTKVSGTPLTTMTASGETDMTIAWQKVTGADGYDIFFSRCNYNGKNVSTRNVKTIEGNSTFVWTNSGLKAGKPYKAYVKAYVMKDGNKQYVASSPLMHAYTQGYTKNYTNAKSVKVNKTKVSIEKGKTFKIKAKVKKLKKGKKLMPKKHVQTLRYMSTDTSIATVSKSGKIRAKNKGTCYIYVYAHNGVNKKIKVTVR